MKKCWFLWKNFALFFLKNKMFKTRSILSKLPSFSVFEFLNYKKRTFLGNCGSKNLPEMDFLVVLILIVCFIMVLFLVFLVF